MLLRILGIIFIYSCSTTLFAADLKLGYVDIQTAIQSTTEGKEAKKQLESEFNKKKKALEPMEKDIKTMGEDLEKKKDVLSEQVKREKQMALQEEMLKYREQVAKSQLEIQNKERELTQPIIEKIRKAIAEIAEKGKYTMILEKTEQSMLWASKESDLTEEVIKSIEKTKKDEKTKK